MLCAAVIQRPQPHARAAPNALLDIDRKRAAHQLCPGAIPTAMRCGVPCIFATVRVLRRTLRLLSVRERWHHQRAKFVSGREHTCIPDDMQLRERHGRSKRTQQAPGSMSIASVPPENGRFSSIRTRPSSSRRSRSCASGGHRTYCTAPRREARPQSARSASFSTSTSGERESRWANSVSCEP
jgi:hypothetical protein